MAEPVTSYIIENDKDFERALQRLADVTNDYRIPFGLIAKEFYRSNKKIFSLAGPGLYPDLSEKYKVQKQRQVGFIYPILFKTGRVASSLLNPSDPEAVRVLTKQNLILGTDVPYVKFHQSDAPRTRLPQRKVIFIDGGPFESSKGASTSGRRETWLNIINQYIIDNIDNFEFNDV